MPPDTAFAADMLADLIEEGPFGIIVTDPDGRLIYTNQTLNRWLGLTDADAGTGTFPQLLTLPGRMFYETHLAPMMRLQGFVREISCSLRASDGETMPVLLSGVARRDDAGDPLRFDYTVFDARERHLYEEQLRAARRHADELAAIVRSSPHAILRINSDGEICSWNEGAHEMFGQTAEDVTGRPLQEVIALKGNPDWFTRAIAQCEDSQATVFETSHIDGLDLDVTVVAIEEDERPLSQRCWSVTLRDISGRKQTERLLKSTLDEMKHRVKNTLSVIGGIARQTLPAEHRQDFTDRLQAFSVAHDVLTRSGIARTGLEDLLSLTRKQAGGPDRFRVSGPTDAWLNPAQVTSLAMGLHELTTNAVKYGSLSVREGYIEFQCSRTPEGEVRLVWQECGGPPVTVPARTGFGTKMIGRVVRSQLQAKVNFDYRSEGLRCEIVFTPTETDVP